jgi:hypothetical protein
MNRVSEDVTISGNQVWNPIGHGLTFHFSELEQIDATATGNWLRAAWGVLMATEWSSFTFTDNTVASEKILITDSIGEPVPDTKNYSGNSYYSDRPNPFAGSQSADGVWTLAQWRTQSGQDADSTLSAMSALPASTWQATTAEGGRLIRVYNPTSAATVEVSTGMTGDWWLYDALNPLAGPVASGTGSTVTVPMTGLTARTPTGLDPVTHPAPTFGVFVARPVSTWVAPD